MRVSIFRRGRVWWVRYSRDGRRCRHSLETENRKIALELLEGVERRLILGEPAVPEQGVPLATFVEEYRAFSLSRKRPKSHATDMRRLGEFLASVEGRNVATVTTADVSRWISQKTLRDGIVPATVLRYREVLHAFFAHAKRLGYIRENPVSAVPRPRLPEKDPRFLGLDQIDELFRVVEGDLVAPLVATLVYAGLRREEVCWVTWNDLDLKSQPPVLRVRGKTVDGESWLPKTKKNRTIPISTKLAAALSRVERNGTPWVFASPEGCRWNPDNLGRHFRALTARAGLPWNFLDLRHTFGSQLARKGVSLIKIAQLMGNSPEIARRHYIHLIPEEMHADVEF